MDLIIVNMLSYTVDLYSGHQYCCRVSSTGIRSEVNNIYFTLWLQQILQLPIFKMTVE